MTRGRSPALAVALSTALAVWDLAPPARAQDLPRPAPRPADLAGPAARPAAAREAAERPAVPRPPVGRRDAALSDAPPPPLRRPTAPPPRISAPAAGRLCGDARLEGRRAAPIDGAGQCAVPDAVTLVSAAGVRINPPVTVGCEVARTFADWLERSAKPAARSVLGGNLVGVGPFAGYACRPRNSQGGAPLSEHAYGRAIDIGAFTVAGAGTIDVLTGWRGKAEHRAFLRRVWRGACGPFGTVLGPEADRWHRNHLHFDVAKHRSGPWCR